MKLLFDQNLSPRLVRRLADLYPGSAHVFGVGLDEADDAVVWNYAHDRGFTIVSKDSDFHGLSIVRGFPPKVAWIRRGNCTTTDIEGILRRDIHLLEELEQRADIGILELH